MVNNPCTPQITEIDGIVQLSPSCNPIDKELISSIISYLISNDVFVINQSASSQTPGNFKIAGKGTATTLVTKKLEILDSTNTVIGSIEYGSI